jgi:hypothetical protein
VVDEAVFVDSPAVWLADLGELEDDALGDMAVLELTEVGDIVDTFDDDEDTNICSELDECCAGETDGICEEPFNKVALEVIGIGTG